MRYPLSIRTQVLLVMAAVSLPMLCLLAWGGYRQVLDARERAHAQGLAMAESAVATIRGFLERAEHRLRVLAERPAVRVPDPPHCESFLADFLRLYPDFANIGILDRHGRIVCAGRPRFVSGEEATRADWFRRAVQEGRSSAGGPFSGAVSGGWVSVVALPLADEKGAGGAVLALAVDSARFERYLRETAGPSGVLTLLDSNGTVVGRSHDHARWVGRQVGGAEAAALALTRNAGHAEATGPDGIPRVYGHAQVPGTDWVVYAGIPADTVYAEARDAAIRNGVLAAVTLLAMAGFAFVLSERIARPVRRLAEAARAARAGPSDARASVAGPREVAETAAEFNALLEARQIAGRALADRERLYRALFQNNPMPMWVQEADTGAIVEVNAAAARHYGYDRDEFLARSSADLEAGPAPQPAGLNGGPGQPHRHRRRDGTVIYVQTASQPIEFEGRGAELVLATDVTARLAAEEALRESEGRYRGLVEVAPDAILVQERGRILFVNPEAVRLYGGASAGDLLGRNLIDLVHPECRAAVAARIEEAARGAGRLPPMEQRIVRLDGTAATVESAGIRVEFAGRPAVLTVQRDITEREQAARALRSSERRFRDVAAAAGEYVWEVDAEGRFTYLSERVEDVLGYRPEELVGKTPAALMPQGEEERVRRWFDENIVPGTAFRDLEHATLTRAGRLIWLRVSGVSMRDAQGRHTGYRGTGRDITERRRAEQEIRRLNAELEARVADRTAQLEAANREMESFCYSVSHDLRAPLRAIDGFSRMLASRNRDRLDAEGLDHLERVIAACRRMSDIIDDLLGLSRVGRAQLRLADTDLSAMAASVLRDLQAAEPERSVEVSVEPGIVAPCDPQTMRLLFENLLGNAWKFTRRTAGARIEFAREEGPEGPVYRVADNGAGFDMHYADKLFQPFQRLHHQTEFEGTGIGLAIVHRIVVRHGGTVHACGEVGRGATFTFTLGGGSGPAATAPAGSAATGEAG